jgi:hypothetical protein
MENKELAKEAREKSNIVQHSAQFFLYSASASRLLTKSLRFDITANHKKSPDLLQSILLTLS